MNPGVLPESCGRAEAAGSLGVWLSNQRIPASPYRPPTASPPSDPQQFGGDRFPGPKRAPRDPHPAEPIVLVSSKVRTI